MCGRCSVLQCVAVCCSVLKCDSMDADSSIVFVLQMHCGVQCVVVCCSVLHRHLRRDVVSYTETHCNTL